MFDLTEKQKNVLMVVCFAYAGIALLLALISFYMVFNDGQLFFLQKFLGGRAQPLGDMIAAGISSVSWMMGIFSLMGAVVTFLAGSALMHHEHKPKAKTENKEIPYSMLLPDEKEIIDILKQNDNVMTQSELVNASGLSKVKIHRMIKKLETKKIISKYAYGMTNKVRLEKEFVEDGS
ncbi:MAG: winged helix-turn-helix transcriptional regulator [Nanoarchaeota archaeon]